LISKGAPVGFVFPKNGTPYFGGDLLIPKNAPDPQLAQMAVNILESLPASQSFLSGSGFATPNKTLQPASTGVGAGVVVASQFVSSGFINVPQLAPAQLNTVIQQWNTLASGG
jgi:spermidine/putrescine-binding protein